MNDEALLAEGERKRMSIPWRIWETCVARTNNWGHAAFRDGELAALCCGMDSPSNRDAVRRGLKTLAEMGRIAPLGKPGSTPNCVLVNRDYVWRGAGKGGRKHVCSETSHMDTREKPWFPMAKERESADVPSDTAATATEPTADTSESSWEWESKKRNPGLFDGLDDIY